MPCWARSQDERRGAKADEVNLATGRICWGRCARTGGGARRSNRVRVAGTAQPPPAARAVMRHRRTASPRTALAIVLGRVRVGTALTEGSVHDNSCIVIDLSLSFQGRHVAGHWSCTAYAARPPDAHRSHTPGAPPDLLPPAFAASRHWMRHPATAPALSTTMRTFRKRPEPARSRRHWSEERASYSLGLLATPRARRHLPSTGASPPPSSRNLR